MASRRRIGPIFALLTWIPFAAAATEPAPPPAAAPGPSPPIAGVIETATVFPGGFKLKAKLDTGARTSSLGVTDFRNFTKNGRDMVAFTVRLADGTTIELQRPMVHAAIIKERGRASVARPVVTMSICIGNLMRQTQVNLQKRDNFLFSLLIGRRYLAGTYAVDPKRRNVLPADCTIAKDVRK